MKFLRNTWYMAAWSDEVSRDPIGRTLLEQPVVFYRTEDGDAVAIGNRCPHRFAPLSMGVLKGDAIECPYHGLQFGSDGICTKNPHGNKNIPKGAQVPVYKVEERYGIIWFWGGAVELADPGTIPDLSYLEDPASRTVTGSLPVSTNYELYIDNLLDLSHTQFVHGDNLQSQQYCNAKYDFLQQGSLVTSKMFIPNSEVLPFYKRFFDDSVTEMDLDLTANWLPPAVVMNDNKAIAKGQEFRSRGLHIVTPESARNSHYFYALTRYSHIDDPEVDEFSRNWHRHGFDEQDKPIIEAASNFMGDEVDPLKMDPVFLISDGGNIRARHELNRLIKAEQEDSDQLIAVATATE